MDKTELRTFKYLAVKALSDRRLEVLGAPFGGHMDGRDADGQFFSEHTDFMIEVGDERPVLYYHGMTPRGTTALAPEVIGKAKLTRIDEKGLWFEVALREGSALAERIWEAAKNGLAKASSGAVNYLVRLKEKTGEILSWPLAELSLIDVAMNRQPANQLASVHLKAAFDNAELKMPEIFVQSGELKTDMEQERDGDHLNKLDKKESAKMPPEVEKEKDTEIQEKPAPTPAPVNIDVSAIKAQVMAEIKAEKEAEAARQAEIDKAKEEAKEEGRKEAQAAYAAWANRKGMPSFEQIINKTGLSDGKDELIHWMRTGDTGAYKVLKPSKALEGGTDSEGGVLVPNDFYASIVAQRDQLSWVRQSGVQVFQTSRDTMDIPVEDTAFANFSVTAEEASYTTNDPAFATVSIPVYKFTKLTKISEELLADDAANLESWFSFRLAEAAANTESSMVAVGTASSQPQGVFVGGTAGLTFDSAAQISEAEIPELFYKLGSGYRQDSVWLMHDEIEAYLRGLRTSINWSFDLFPQNVGVMGDWKWGTFYGGRRMATETTCATMASAAKVILVGNFRYYALVERAGLELSRNPYLYQATGQVGFFAKFRMGGAVLQAGAFQYGTMA